MMYHTPLQIVAHRGESYLAPENSMASIQLGYELGAETVEIDVRLTADGQIVLMHDPTTGRTGGVDWRVAERTLAQLRTLDIGLWKGTQYAGQRIPTLGEALDAVPPHGGMFVELKGQGEPDFADAVLNVLEGHPAAERITLIGFDGHLLAQFRQRWPGVCSLLGGFGFDRAGYRELGMMLDEAQRVGAKAVGFDERSPLTVDAAAQVRERGLGFHVWTVDLPQRASELMALGLDTLTTNRPNWLRHQLEAMALPK